MNIRSSFLILVIFVNSVHSQELTSLNKGSPYRDGPDFTQSHKLTIWDYEDWASESGIMGFESIIAYLENDADDAFVLSRDLNLGLIGVANRGFEEYWSLSRWSHQYISPYVRGTYALLNVSYPDKTYSLDRYPYAHGCLDQTPLRYGDIEANSASELVLFLNNDLVVFSPEYGQIVFAESYVVSDWVGTGMTQDIYDRYGYSSEAVRPQYLSALAAYNDTTDFKGTRVYAKLYVGEFDEDSHSDIIVWRKTYRSRNTNDPVNGFELIDQEWQHFERDLVAQEESDQGVTGEYLPQETPSQEIQAWLIEDQLTWVQGYPSVSECEGKEGELILEMHDPLLNDPEVLE